MKKSSSTVAEPLNPEQLRYRIALMGVCLMFLGFRHTNKAALQGITLQLFDQYLKYLLGEFVWLLAGRSASGHLVSTPHWAQLLVYEFAIRKQVYLLLLNTSQDFDTALRGAWKDPVIKERYFTTPLAMACMQGVPRNPSLKRASPDADFPPAPPGAPAKGNGRKAKARAKAKGKAKGKGKGGKLARGICAAKTPEGLSVCFGFNNAAQGCTVPNCSFQHVCGICFRRHPLFQCTGNGARPETQGAGAV